jgi:putative SOS response-associated peptidase YedK
MIGLGRQTELSMCGRYLIISSPEAIRRFFRYPEQPNFPARYNVAPTQPVPIVRIVEGQRQFALVRWGLIPAWVNDPRTFALLINARGESVNDKPAFRYAMKRRRCLIPADGFYEWKDEGRSKRPYVVRPKDGGPIAFAGLWETWMGPNGEEMETVAIITTLASRDIAHIHHRMPVIVPVDAFDFWLDCTNVDATTAAALIAPAPTGLLDAYEISSAVNRAANDSPALIEPAPTPLEQPALTARGPAATAPVKRPRKPKEDDRQSSLF